MQVMLCYICMLMICVGDVMLYLYANGMRRLRLGYICTMMVYMCKLRLEILINSMRYVCYNFFLLKYSG
jgi:hypothetical protein